MTDWWDQFTAICNRYEKASTSSSHVSDYSEEKLPHVKIHLNMYKWLSGFPIWNRNQFYWIFTRNFQKESRALIKGRYCMSLWMQFFCWINILDAITKNTQVQISTCLPKAVDSGHNQVRGPGITKGQHKAQVGNFCVKSYISHYSQNVESGVNTENPNL